MAIFVNADTKVHQRHAKGAATPTTPTIADVKTGDTVRLAAVVAGNSANAVQINDTTTLQQHRGPWAPKPRRGKPGGPAGSPASPPTTTG